MILPLLMMALAGGSDDLLLEGARYCLGVTAEPQGFRRQADRRFIAHGPSPVLVFRQGDGCMVVRTGARGDRSEAGVEALLGTLPGLRLDSDVVESGQRVRNYSRSQAGGVQHLRLIEQQPVEFELGVGMSGFSVWSSDPAPALSGRPKGALSASLR